MDEAELARSCEKEIVELHRFFMDWFCGAVTDSDAVWSRVTDVLAPEFVMIAPEGRAFLREELLASVRARYGSHAPERDFEIWIRNLDCRHVAEHVVLTTYEEWQRRAGETSGRLSTAVFERVPDTPNGVRWLHVHETWLQAPQEA